MAQTFSPSLTHPVRFKKLSQKLRAQIAPRIKTNCAASCMRIKLRNVVHRAAKLSFPARAKLVSTTLYQPARHASQQRSTVTTTEESHVFYCMHHICNPENSTKPVPDQENNTRVIPNTHICNHENLHRTCTTATIPNICNPRDFACDSGIGARPTPEQTF